MEETIFYILIFCVGALFGSFFTLAVYRIPLRQDITHKRSYCPSCNHKLSFWDMIPILSYIFLGGKCRYCKSKIRIRYFLLEILTGIVFLLFAMSINLSFMPIKISQIAYLIIAFLYLAGIIIIAGIDKEKHKIENSVLLYEIIVTSIYMIYLYIVAKTNIYRYVIYLIFLLIFVALNNTYLKKKLKNSYTLEILQLSMIMAIFGGEKIYVATVILTLLSIAIERIEKLILSRNNRVSRKESSYYKNLPLGFYIICSNIISIILINFTSMQVIK